MSARFAVIFAVFVTACSSSSGGSGSSTYLPVPTVQESADTSVCHDAQNVAASVTKEVHQAKLPAASAAGGDFVSGVYVLTSDVEYTSGDASGSPTWTIVVDGSKWYMVNGPSGKQSHVTVSMSAAGSTLQQSSVCSNNANWFPGTLTYTASESGFTIYDAYPDPFLGYGEIFQFTRK